MATTTVPPPLRSTANPAPPRKANSVRRTMSIDVSWPDGETGGRLFVGRCRDYRTPPEGGTEFFPKRMRPRVAVWLEHRQHTVSSR